MGKQLRGLVQLTSVPEGEPALDQREALREPGTEVFGHLGGALVDHVQIIEVLATLMQWPQRDGQLADRLPPLPVMRLHERAEVLATSLEVRVLVIARARG